MLQQTMEEKLQSLHPTHCQIVEESKLHGGYQGYPTHFKVELVSAQFAGMGLLARHRVVQDLLASELAQIKACSLFLFAPEEWPPAQPPRSPACTKSHKP